MSDPQLALSQNKVARRWGITQAAISRYINGVLRLNVEIVLKFATSLRVEPETIDPRITQFMRKRNNRYTMALVVRDKTYEPRIIERDWINLDTLNKPKPGKLTAAHWDNRLVLGYYDEKGVLYHPLTREEQPIPPTAFLNIVTGIIPKENT